MFKLTTLTAVCALSLGLATHVHAQDASTVVATVNGTDITLGHMIAYRESLGEQAASMPAPGLYEAVLDQLISMAVLSEGRELADGDRYIIQNEERSLKARGAVMEMSQGDVSDDEIQAAYDEMFADFEGQEEYNASHILVETEEEADALIEELNGDADFAQLAQENSTGPSGPSGGELGWFGPGQMVPAFDEAVQGMDVGEIAGPVETQFGWHVIRLNDTRTSEAPSMEELRPRLEQMVMNTRITDAVEQKRAAATIETPEVEIDPALINDGSLIGQ